MITAWFAAISPARISLIVLGAAFLSVAIWLLVLALVAWTGGWRSLARRYRGLREPKGLTLSWRNLSLGRWTNYRGCIRLILAPQGVYLVPVFLFRFGHAPLLLPWEKACPRETMRRFGRDFRFLTIQLDSRTVRIELPDAGWKWIDRNLKEPFRSIVLP